MPLNQENAKTVLTQMGDFLKLIKERANGKKAEEVAY